MWDLIKACMSECDLELNITYFNRCQTLKYEVIMTFSSLVNTVINLFPDCVCVEAHFVIKGYVSPGHHWML